MRYFQEFWRTIHWSLEEGTRFDLAFGVNGLNALACLVLKHLGFVRRVVYYTIDYIPSRFSNALLNGVYHRIDSLCVRHADLVWNLSSRMIEGREALGIPQRYRDKQVEVPIGIQYSSIAWLPAERVDRYRVAYVGHLVERQGVELLLEAVPEVLRHVPQARFRVVGGGSLEADLRRRADFLGVAHAVEFCGLVTDRQAMEELVSCCALGLAPYRPTVDNFTYYADPTKPKDYLGMGLPVIITDVPAVARMIQAADAGDVIPYDAGRLAAAIVRLLTDDELWLRQRENARRLAKQYDWDDILGTALDASWATLFESATDRKARRRGSGWS